MPSSTDCFQSADGCRIGVAWKKIEGGGREATTLRMLPAMALLPDWCGGSAGIWRGISLADVSHAGSICVHCRLLHNLVPLYLFANASAWILPPRSSLCRSPLVRIHDTRCSPSALVPSICGCGCAPPFLFHLSAGVQCWCQQPGPSISHT